MGANDFLEAISEEKGGIFPGPMFLSHPFLWDVKILGGSNLRSEINRVLDKGRERWQASVDIGDYEKSISGSIIIARAVTIPNETIEVVDFGQENRGGFLPGYGLTQRSSFLQRNIVISFLDTDNDIVHEFMRPWCIAVGIDGMLNTDLRADIQVTQYNNEGRPRKKIEFRDAFPTNVEGYTVNHTADDFIESQVSFACRNYVNLNTFG